VVPWLGVGDESSSGVLNMLQRSDGGLGKACEYSVAIVESAAHKSRDQTLGAFFTSRATDLTQLPQLKESTADNTIDVLLHRQLIFEVEATISYDFDWLDDVITD